MKSASGARRSPGCAIDIGTAGLGACARVPHDTRADRQVQEVREYATVTPALLALADRLRCEQAQVVAMRATRSIRLLDGAGISAQSTRELTSIVYSLRTDGLRGTGAI